MRASSRKVYGLKVIGRRLLVTMAIFPRSGELMKSPTSPSWHPVADHRNPHGARLAWDGEVPFIF